jgi:hypothetical protein
MRYVLKRPAAISSQPVESASKKESRRRKATEAAASFAASITTLFGAERSERAFETALPPWAREFDTPAGSLRAQIHEAAREFDTHVAPSLGDVVEPSDTDANNDGGEGGPDRQATKKSRVTDE